MKKPGCRIKGVIFDLGRTLLYLGERCSHVDAVATATLVEFLETNGFSLSEDFVPRFRAAREAGMKLAEQTEREQTMEDALRASLPLADRSALNGILREATEAYFLVREQYWLANDGAIEVLKTLSARGLRLGAISNSEHDTLMRRAVERLGFSFYLTPLITSAEAKWRKPNPHIFELVAREWDLEPGEIVMVGNSLEEDIVGAHRAGMRGILLKHDRGRPYGKGSTSLVPDATVRFLAEIPNAIDWIQSPRLND